MTGLTSHTIVSSQKKNNSIFIPDTQFFINMNAVFDICFLYEISLLTGDIEINFSEI